MQRAKLFYALQLCIPQAKLLFKNLSRVWINSKAKVTRPTCSPTSSRDLNPISALIWLTPSEQSVSGRTAAATATAADILARKYSLCCALSLSAANTWKLRHLPDLCCSFLFMCSDQRLHKEVPVSQRVDNFFGPFFSATTRSLWQAAFRWVFFLYISHNMKYSSSSSL